jgi:hypothetical protein
MNRRIFIFKLSLVSVILFGLLISCETEVKKNTVKSISNPDGIAKIKFDTTYYDYGTLIQGEKVIYTFKFKNIGDADLVILDAYSTCGCTVPNYNKEPIAPGSDGKIEVLFDSSGKRGIQYKTVTLKLNTKQKEKSLNIKANVLENNYKS